MKKCTMCKQTLPINSFNKCKTRKDGLHVYCKQCRKIDYVNFRKKHDNNYKTVSEINNEKILNYSYMPDKIDSLIRGTILGDACIIPNIKSKNGHCKLQVGHSSKQIEWITLKYSLLKNYCTSFDVQERFNANFFYSVYTKSIPYFTNLRKIWYNENGKKIVPIDEIKKLDDFSIAVWYLDDGNLARSTSTQCVICSEGFSIEENELLVKYFNSIGIDCNVRMQNVTKPRIFFTHKGKRELHSRIAKFVPLSMRYKIMDEFHSIAFDAGFYEISFYDDVELFHKKFNIPRPNKPILLSKDIFEYRVKFIKEEISEFIQAYKDNNLEEAFDALLDMIYVVCGTGYLSGISGLIFHEGFKEVHRANMQKEKVKFIDESKRGHIFDLKKPEGWQPPNLLSLVYSKCEKCGTHHNAEEFCK